MAPLTFPILSVFVYTAFPVTYDRVQQVIDDAEVITLGIGTGVDLGFELFGTTASTFTLDIGNDIRFRFQGSQFDS
ncbi:MAG: hypothetical protein KKD28_10285 [Chloroflexi bacterium]|nr:hypothetical protein [Chloroflexota bacterium]MBU1661845.1 hypothetical protein [Chloroflexota bacterium]